MISSMPTYLSMRLARTPAKAFSSSSADLSGRTSTSVPSGKAAPCSRTTVLPFTIPLRVFRAILRFTHVVATKYQFTTVRLLLVQLVQILFHHFNLFLQLRRHVVLLLHHVGRRFGDEPGVFQLRLDALQVFLLLG